MHTVHCDRCKRSTELLEKPKSKGFLCNSCWMKWNDIKAKMIGHAYQDEVDAAFIKFVNSLAFLKNHTI